MCDLNLTYKENVQCSGKLNVIHTLVHFLFHCYKYHHENDWYSCFQFRFPVSSKSESLNLN